MRAEFNNPLFILSHESYIVLKRGLGWTLACTYFFFRAKAQADKWLQIFLCVTLIWYDSTKTILVYDYVLFSESGLADQHSSI